MIRLRNARRAQRHTGRLRKVQRYGRTTTQRYGSPRLPVAFYVDHESVDLLTGYTDEGLRFTIYDSGPKGTFTGTIDAQPETVRSDREQKIDDAKMRNSLDERRVMEWRRRQSSATVDGSQS